MRLGLEVRGDLFVCVGENTDDAGNYVGRVGEKCFAPTDAGFVLLEILVVVTLIGLFLPVVASSLSSIRRGWRDSDFRETRLLAIENVLQRRDWSDAVVGSVEAYSPSYNIAVIPISAHEEIRVLVVP